MQRTDVESSNIRSIGYDSNTRVLEVEFTSGKVYQYPNVPAEAHTDLMKADSVGSFFARNIRAKYNGAPIGEENE